MSLKPGGTRGSLRQVSVGAESIPDSVTDSFEDESLSEYASASDFGTTTNRAWDGSVSAVCTADATHSNMWWDESVSTADTAKTVSVYFYYDGTKTRGGPTLVDSAGGGYKAYINIGGDLANFNIQLKGVTEDSSGDQLGSTEVDPATDAWYILELQDDGADTYTARILDTSDSELASASATDATYDVDRFGLHAYDSGWEMDLLELNNQ